MDDTSGKPDSGTAVYSTQSLLADDWGRRNSTGINIASNMSLESIGLEIDGYSILDDISLEVEAGKILCLLGPSGSGKTSLLRIAAGLAEATSGTLKIDGRVVSNGGTFVPPEKRGIGMVFQDYALFPHMNILENVEFGLTELARSEARSHAMHVLSRVGLEHRAGDYPHQLSGGEQQRVALARALAPKPRIIMMDEPFSGLDSRLREKVRDQSLEILRETRSTAVIVTHDPEEALRMADRIALVREGKLVQVGTGRDLYFKPESLFAAGFFSELNVMPAKRNGGKISTILGSKQIEEHDNANEWIGAVRQTDLKVVPAGRSGKGKAGRIFSRQFVGRSELLEVVIEGMEEPLLARIRAGVLDPGVTDVQISVDREALMFFPADRA